MYRNVVRDARAGTRYPVFLCHHFSYWYGPERERSYWAVLKTVIRDMAELPDVEFPSYVELADRFDSGYEPPVIPFVGTTCIDHGECMDLDGGFCMMHGDEVLGFCTIGCERTCPDRSGHATTFCVASDELTGVGLPSGDLSELPGGVCVSKSERKNAYCQEVAGTTPQTMSRFSEPSRSADVCAPVR